MWLLIEHHIISRSITCLRKIAITYEHDHNGSARKHWAHILLIFYFCCCSNIAAWVISARMWPVLIMISEWARSHYLHGGYFVSFNLDYRNSETDNMFSISELVTVIQAWAKKRNGQKFLCCILPNSFCKSANWSRRLHCTEIFNIFVTIQMIVNWKIQQQVRM